MDAIKGCQLIIFSPTCEGRKEINIFLLLVDTGLYQSLMGVHKMLEI